MSSSTPNGFVEVTAMRLLELCSKKERALGIQRRDAHERAVKEKMKGRKRWHWWKGWVPDVDISYREADLEYSSDHKSQFGTFPSERELRDERYNHAVRQTRRMMMMAEENNKALLSVEALAFLTHGDE